MFGIALGCIAALKPGSVLDTVLGVTSVAFITTPAFVVAIFLLLIFSLQLHWLPVTGAGDPDDPLDRLSHSCCRRPPFPSAGSAISRA